VSAIGDGALLFMHLPKTGGTAIRTALLDVYADRDVGLIYEAGELDGAMSREQFASLSDEEIRRFAMIAGHFAFGLHRRSRPDSRYVTIVRDPVDRVVSLFYHFRTLPGIRFGGRSHRERWRMRLRRTTIVDWVFAQGRVDADNLMVRNIAGARRVAFGHCTQGMLEDALGNIDRWFAAVLVQDDMVGSARVLEQVIGRSMPSIDQVNHNPKRPALAAIDPGAVARIRELNQFDQQLHVIARTRLAAALAQMPEARDGARP
jgi:Sulfotransferase family